MMNLFPSSRILICLILTAILLTSCHTNSENRIYQKQSPYNFEDTILYLDIAISEFNYRIIHRSEIGQAIRDRGDKNFPLSTITNFCNITYAHEMLLINPDLINEMPCTIAVREDEQGHVIISTKLMDTEVKNSKQRDFANKINQNLIGIIGATTE